jgi:adenylate cyclase
VIAPRLKNRKKSVAALLIAAAVFAVCALASLTGLFNFLEYKTYDLRVNLFAPSSKPSDDVVVVLLDQASIDWAKKERGWSWPWPRKAYAQIVDYMKVANAKAIAFDVLFSESSAYGIGDDDIFVKSSGDFGGAVHAAFFGGGEVSKSLSKPFLGDFETEDHINDNQLPPDAQFPIKSLHSAARVIGSVTGRADSDGVFRRYKLFARFEDKAIPSLAAASLIAAGEEAKLVRADDRFIEWGERKIPVDRNGAILLRFKGDLNRYIPYSAADILRSSDALATGGEALLPPDDFEGKYVFFGFYAPGLYDIFASPISSAYPGVGMHVTMLDNILSNDFIVEFSLWANILTLFLAISLSAFTTLYVSRVYLSVTALVAVLAALAGLSGFFYAQGFWMIVVAPIAGALVAFLAASLYNYAVEYGQKRFIKSAFSQYLSPAVIEALIADPAKLKLGGEEREMTAIFTDIRGFSTISEALKSPSKLVELLNYYLTVMSDIILDHQGAIDKYEGDAIIAFFGAPIYVADHAALACKAAIEMKKAERRINDEAIKRGLIPQEAIDALERKGVLRGNPTPLYTRIGVNTGAMVVGNMGTPRKMNYTIMGNAVNLAARLEGVNKQYDTSGVLISEYTKDKIGDEFIARRLSRARVVGVNTPLRLYELWDLRKNAAPSLEAALTEWDRGLERYEKRDFSKALEIFNALYLENNRDLVAKLYANRAQAYLLNPPTDRAWDEGIDNLIEK